MSYKKNKIIKTLIFGVICATSLQVKAQNQPLSTQPNSTTSFNIFCDPNGGGTGECRREDNQNKISCEFASQNFIQCKDTQNNTLICVNFSPGQFECQATQSGPLIDNQQKCSTPLDSLGNCRNPLRNVLSPGREIQQLSPQQTIKSTRFTKDTLTETLGN